MISLSVYAGLIKHVSSLSNMISIERGLVGIGEGLGGQGGGKLLPMGGRES